MWKGKTLNKSAFQALEGHGIDSRGRLNCFFPLKSLTPLKFVITLSQLTRISIKTGSVCTLILK